MKSIKRVGDEDHKVPIILIWNNEVFWFYRMKSYLKLNQVQK